MHKQATEALISRHVQALPYIWPLIEGYGLTVEQCLQGTGLNLEQAWGRQDGMTLDQEFALYRNLLQLTDDKYLGLKLGAQYRPETYGMFGYALMSAKNISTLLDVSARFFDLSYSHFRLKVSQQGSLLVQYFEPRYPMPDDLVQLFSDRDLSAAFTLGQSLGLVESYISEVHLSYSDNSKLAHFESHFGCTVKMGQPFSAVGVPSSFVLKELPWRNERAMDSCLQVCRELLDEIYSQGTLKSKVVEELINTPGHYPSLESVAEKLGMSTRSLRRKLQQSGTSYKELLQEVRLNLSKQYLKDGLSVEQIAELLGYSETSTFSRAFKNWTGQPPQDFRS